MGEQVHTLYGLYLPLPVRGNRIRQAHQENGAVYLPQKYLIAHRQNTGMYCHPSQQNNSRPCPFDMGGLHL